MIKAKQKKGGSIFNRIKRIFLGNGEEVNIDTVSHGNDLQKLADTRDEDVHVVKEDGTEIVLHPKDVFINRVHEHMKLRCW